MVARVAAVDFARADPFGMVENGPGVFPGDLPVRGERIDDFRVFRHFIGKNPDFLVDFGTMTS